MDGLQLHSEPELVEDYEASATPSALYAGAVLILAAVVVLSMLGVTAAVMSVGHH